VQYQQKEALLPVNEQTLQKIDRKKQILHTRLPEGLLEIY
jgi:16S rRNA processing protein RimM